MTNITKIEFSIKNILLILGLFIGLFLMWKLQIVIFMFYFAFILSSALRPLVEILKNKGVPRTLSVFLIYLATFLILGGFTYLIGAVMVDQVKNLTDNSNEIVTDVIIRVTDTFPGAKDAFEISDDQDFRTEVSKQVDEFLAKGLPNIFNRDTLGGASNTIISTINNAVAIFFGIFTVLVMSAYMTNSEKKFYKGIVELFPDKKLKDFISSIGEKVESKLGAWFAGQIALMLIIGMFTFIGLEVPGLFVDTTISKYAVPLALFAGILEALPNIGPTITWFVAIIVMIGSNATVFEIIYVGLLFIAIQQIEAILVVPLVMKKAIGIDPIVTILGLLAATSLFGIIGAILVLPTLATIQIIVGEIIGINNKDNSLKKKEKIST